MKDEKQESYKLGKYEIYTEKTSSVYVCSYCGKSGKGTPVMFKESKFKIKAYHSHCSEIFRKELELELGISEPVKDPSENFSSPVTDFKKNESITKDVVIEESDKEKPSARVIYKDKKIILLHPYHKNVIETYHRFGIKYNNERWESNIARADVDTCKFLLSINKKLNMFSWSIGSSALQIISNRLNIALKEEKAVFDKLNKKRDDKVVEIENFSFLKATPFPYQKKGIEFLNKIDGIGMIGDEMGLGKSFQTIAYAAQHNLKTVIICPATLKYNWANEIKKFTDKSTYVLTEMDDTPLRKIQTINLIIKYTKAKEKFEKKHHKRFDAALNKAIDECEKHQKGEKFKVKNFNKLISFINLYNLPATKEKQIGRFLKDTQKTEIFVNYVNNLSKENELLIKDLKEDYTDQNFLKLNKAIKDGTVDMFKHFNDLFFLRELKKYKQTIVKEQLKELEDFTIVNFEQLEKFEDILSKAKFDLVVVDESQYIKNLTSLRTKKVFSLFKNVPRRILLSGTAIKNRPIELYSQLKFLHPKIFSQKHRFATRYCDAKKGHFGWDYSGASNLKELYEKISAFYLRRLKNDVLTELPEKTITKIELEMSDEERNQYQRMIDEHNKKYASLKEAVGHSTEELALLMKLRQFCSHNKVKKVVNFVDDILESNEDKKIIIFSQFKQTQQQLFNELKKNHVVGSLFADYSDKKRQEEVDRFQTDPYTRVFVSSLGAGGVGITLTEADTVIFADLAWSPSDHKQAEDRAHRLGQVDPVFVYYLTYRNSIESSMWKKIGKKLEIISQALDGDLDQNVGSIRKEIYADMIIRDIAQYKD